MPCLDSKSQTIVTESKPSDFPSLLRQKLSTVQTVERHKIQTEAFTKETCEKCGRTEVRFSSVQLRGADEGSTNFFTCDCGHKYVEAKTIVQSTRLLTMTLDGVQTTEARVAIFDIRLINLKFEDVTC
jgi:DNA-directed RNA polymerase I subunit RPA12